MWFDEKFVKFWFTPESDTRQLNMWNTNSHVFQIMETKICFTGSIK